MNAKSLSIFLLSLNYGLLLAGGKAPVSNVKRNVKLALVQKKVKNTHKKNSGSGAQASVVRTETIRYNGRNYNLKQLATIGQSRVSGEAGDATCFSQSVIHGAAILDYLATDNQAYLMPLVDLGLAKIKLAEITALLDRTAYPRDVLNRKSKKGFYQNLEIASGCAFLAQHGLKPLARNQILLNSTFLQQAKLNKTRLVEQGICSGNAADAYQISDNSFAVIKAFRENLIDSFGVVLHVSGHYVSVVFKKNQHNIDVYLSDSAAGVVKLHDQWAKVNIFEPLFDFVNNFNVDFFIS
jgi:hypothetical protein